MILAVCANPSVDSFWSIKELQKGTVNRSVKESFYPGGKGIHVAFALRELGETVSTLGVWGGMTGQWLKEECQENNITVYGPEVKEWTRICITNRSATDWDETEFLGAGPTLKDRQINSFVSAYEERLKQQAPETVIISGSVPDGFSNDIYHQLITKAQSFDIPAFIDASGKLLTKALKAEPYAVHINIDEGYDLTGYEKPEKIARWLKKYCDLAAVTAGANGLYMAHKDNIYHAKYKIDSSKITSTVGSGDCLLAGLSQANLEYGDPRQWARLATACGSANCIHPKLGMLDKTDVSTIFDQVTIKKL